jgi:hypothetical protein
MSAERCGALKRDNLVVFRGDQQSGCGHMGCVTPGLEFIEHQPMDGKEGKLTRGDLFETVVGRHENQTSYGETAREVNGDAAAEAAADHRDRCVVGVHAVE